MIDVLDRRDQRGFIHKVLIQKAVKFSAGLVPGGSTALGLATAFAGSRGGGAPRPGRLGKAGRKACRASGGTILRRQGANTICVPRGGTATAAVRRAPSVPPVNPVRALVVQAKPVEALKALVAPKARIPVVAPVPQAHVAFPSPTGFPAPSRTLPLPFRPRVGPRTPIAPRRPAMPIHARARREITSLIGGGGDGCTFPARLDPLTGDCRVFLGEQSGRDDAPIGQAVMGKYGAAYFPGSMIIDRAVCLPGDVVGDDGMCYPKRSIKNSDREWPRGRRPLLTGGDMRAISIAHRAGARMTRAAGRLQDMGIIKKPIVRKQIKKKN